MKMPGFTAEATLFAANPIYRVGAPNTMESNALRLAIRNAPTPIVFDCADWPNSINCKECGNTGSGTFVCCPPGKNCVVVTHPKPTQNWGVGWQWNAGNYVVVR